jgi:hypothetical protein
MLILEINLQYGCPRSGNPNSTLHQMVERSGSSKDISVAGYYPCITMTTGYDENVVGSFQSMKPWVKGP